MRIKIFSGVLLALTATVAMPGAWAAEARAQRWTALIMLVPGRSQRTARIVLALLALHIPEVA